MLDRIHIEHGNINLLLEILLQKARLVEDGGKLIITLFKILSIICNTKPIVIIIQKKIFFIITTLLIMVKISRLKT